MNISRGCVHGCIYCDARSKCYHIDHEFEDVEIKANAPQLLEEALRKKRKKCMIGAGAMSDPYIPLPENLDNIRACLEIIERYGNNYLVNSDNNDELMGLFNRICDENTIATGVDKLFDYMRVFEERNTKGQLKLFC
jgi:hypothetical protein